MIIWVIICILIFQHSRGSFGYLFIIIVIFIIISLLSYVHYGLVIGTWGLKSQ